MVKLAPNLRSSVLGICFLVFAGVVAYQWWLRGPAAISQARPSGLFDRYDRNGNGVARLDEVAEVDREQFEFLLERAGQTELAALTRAQFERALHAPRQIVIEPTGESSSEASPEAEVNDLTNAKDGKVEAGQPAEPTVGPSNVSDRAEQPVITPTMLASADAHDSFARLDTDGDGLLSRDEFTDFFETLPQSARIETRSASDITDQAAVAGDTSSPVPLAGKITADAQPMAPSSAALAPADEVVIGFLPRRLFQKLDKDHDGAISTTEIPRSNVARLMRGDTDSDGRLSLGEFAAMFGNRGGDVKNASGSHRRRRGGLITRPASGEKVPVYEPTKSEPQSEAEVPSWFRQRDLNQDHQVAQSEWPTMALAEFRRVDANDDGFISLTEAAVQDRTGERKTTP